MHHDIRITQKAVSKLLNTFFPRPQPSLRSPCMYACVPSQPCRSKPARKGEMVHNIQCSSNHVMCLGGFGSKCVSLERSCPTDQVQLLFLLSFSTILFTCILHTKVYARMYNKSMHIKHKVPQQPWLLCPCNKSLCKGIKSIHMQI